MSEPVIGVAGHRLRDPNSAAAERAAFRSAVKRVGGRPGAPAEPDAPKKEKPRRHAARAEQAALGMMDKPPGRSSDADLKSWLETMEAGERERLSKLLWTVRRDRGEAGPGQSRIEKALEGQGIRLDINGQNITINLTTGTQGNGAGRQSSWRPRSRSADWGRIGLKLREFVNGH